MDDYNSIITFDLKGASMSKQIEGLSVIVPAYNEEKNVGPLYEKIKASLARYPFAWEVIFVDDGSEDDTFSVLCALASEDRNVKVIRFKRNFGKGAAYSAGIKMASYPVLATMDADLQDDPNEISKFIKKIEQGYEYVTGWKYKGKGSLGKALPSRIFNFVVSRATDIHIHDFNCPYKVFLQDVIESHEIYGELYRFMPIIAVSKGCSIAEVKIENYPRLSGKSKYGWERFLRGFFDFLTIFFVSGYMKRPLHFFGSIGLVHLLIGASGLFGLYIRKLLWGYPISDYLFLFIIVIFLMVAGLQFISIGLMSELIIRLKAHDRNFYHIRETMNL